jgi:hypothetical protein
VTTFYDFVTFAYCELMAQETSGQGIAEDGRSP